MSDITLTALQSTLVHVLCIAATLRLSILIIHDAGPYDVLEQLRYKVGVRYNDQHQRFGITTWGRGILCLHCVSVWAAMVVTALHVASGGLSLWMAPVATLGYSMVAIIIGGYYDPRRD
jgi:hypothetical protein